MRDGGRQFADRRNLGRSRKTCLRVSQRLLHILPIVDIQQQSVPASHSAFAVARGLAEHVKPSVDTVGPAEPALDFVRLASCDSTRPRAPRRLHVVRVKKIGPAQALPGVKGRAAVAEYPPVQVVEIAVGSRAPHQTGHGLDDQAEIALACLQGFLGTLSIFSISEQDVPADDMTLRVPQREAAHIEPSIHAIETPEAVFDVIRFSGFHRMTPSSDYAAEIVWMYCA